MTRNTKNVEELKSLIDSIFEPIITNWDDRPILVLLKGDLGAGKTTVTQFLAHLFHVERPIKSPTFTYVHEYEFEVNNTSRTFYHWDFWRMQSEDIRTLGVQKLVRKGSVHVIEWWDKFADEINRIRFDSDAIAVNISLTQQVDTPDEGRVVEWEVTK